MGSSRPEDCFEKTMFGSCSCKWGFFLDEEKDWISFGNCCNGGPIIYGFGVERLERKEEKAVGEDW